MNTIQPVVTNQVGNTATPLAQPHIVGQLNQELQQPQVPVNPVPAALHTAPATVDAERIAKYLCNMPDADKQHLIHNRSPFGFLMRFNPFASIFGAAKQAPSAEFKIVADALEKQLQTVIAKIQSPETNQAVAKLLEQASQGVQLQVSDPLQDAVLKSLEANAEMIKGSSLLHVLEVADKKAELIADAQNYLLMTQPKQIVYDQLKNTSSWQSALNSLHGVETILANLNLMVANASVPKEISSLFEEFGNLHDGFSTKAEGLFKRFGELMEQQGGQPGSRFVNAQMSHASVNGQPVHHQVSVQADPATQAAMAPELQAFQQTQVATPVVQQSRVTVAPQQQQASNPLASVLAQTQGQNPNLN